METSRSLDQKELRQLIMFAPGLKAAQLEFKLKGESLSYGAGSIGIIGICGNKEEITIHQTAEEWRKRITPKEVQIYLRGKNIDKLGEYRDGILDRGYELHKGTLVFDYWGNTENPDKDSGEDALARIADGKVELLLGRETSQERKTQLRDWFKEFL